MKSKTQPRFNQNEILKQIKETGIYTADITPSANFLKVTQDTGYKPYQAVNDLIDNCLDADATNVNLEIGTQNDKPFLIMADNGKGMSVNTMCGSLVLGADNAELGTQNKTTETGTQGRFGTGMKTSIATFQGKAKIISKTKNSEFFTITYNIDEMLSNGGYHTPIKSSSAKDILLFNEHINNSDSGTLIFLYDIEKFNVSAKESQKTTMIKSIGQTFRRFINSDKCSFNMNGKPIYAIDPMMYENPVKDGKVTYKSKIYKTVEFNDLEYTDLKGNLKRDGWMKFTFYELPNADAKSKGKNSWAERHGVTVQKSGFYILRNNREIMQAQTLGMFNRNSIFSYLRCNVDTNCQIDSITGIDFKKINMDFKKYLLDRIRTDCTSTYVNWRREVDSRNPSKKISNNQKKFNQQFINHMRSIKNLLPKLPSNTTNTPVKPSNPTGRKNKSYTPQDNVVINYFSGGEYGKVWEGNLLDNGSKKVELLINEDHKLNTDFMVKGSQELMSAVTGMMAGLTLAKWINVPDGLNERDEYLERWNLIESDCGKHLRTILNGLI